MNYPHTNLQVSKVDLVENSTLTKDGRYHLTEVRKLLSCYGGFSNLVSNYNFVQ